MVSGRLLSGLAAALFSATIVLADDSVELQHKLQKPDGKSSPQPQPQVCKGECWSHDPSVVFDDKTKLFHRFETGGLIRSWQAPTLNGPWTPVGNVLPEQGSIIKMNPRPDGSDPSKDSWAPQVYKTETVWICYYALSTFGTGISHIGYAVSQDLVKWEDRGSTGVSSKLGGLYNAIDPALIQDGSGYSMVFGSWAHGIFEVPLTADATHKAPDAHPVRISFNSTGTSSQEGPFIWKQSDTFYLFLSSGSCCGLDKKMPSPGEEYKIYVCRSDTVRGPFVDDRGHPCVGTKDGDKSVSGGKLVLGTNGDVYGPGGQGMITVDNRQVLYYHYMRKGHYADSDTTFGWNFVSWEDGWPVVVE